MSPPEGVIHPGFDVAAFLAERGRPASVSTVTARGRPALATMWFLLAEGRLWFHTPAGGQRPSPFLRAAARGDEVAAMVATFDPPDDVRQFRATGCARLEPTDHAVVRRIYGRYLDAWDEAWEQQAASERYQLWSVSPDTGMAVSFPGLTGGNPHRWSTAPALLQGH